MTYVLVKLCGDGAVVVHNFLFAKPLQDECGEVVGGGAVAWWRCGCREAVAVTVALARRWR
jgi:hypothetical protein